MDMETGECKCCERLAEQLEVERLRLAACGAAALGYFDGCKDEYRSASLEDVLRLREQLEAVTRERDEKDKQVASLYQKWTDAQKECESLRADAERYRWLRANALWDNGYGEMDLCGGIRCNRAPNHADIDAAIDAAMKEKEA